jgi:transcriptional regulator GlxA family with amidase domain
MPSDRQFSKLAESAAVGDRLSQLYRNMRSNIDKEVSLIDLAGLAALLPKTNYLLTRG